MSELSVTVSRLQVGSQRLPGELWPAIKAVGSAGHRGNNKTHISTECKSVVCDRGVNPGLRP